MCNTTKDVRTQILERTRAVERSLAGYLGAETTLSQAARSGYLPSAVRADLTWMADLQAQLGDAWVPTARDAEAVAAGAERVQASIAVAIGERGFVRLDRAIARAVMTSLGVGCFGVLAFAGMFIGMFWLGPPPPTGYQPAMFGMLKLGGGSLALAFVLTLLRVAGPMASAAGRWAKRHPVRASIWAIGVPLVLSTAYVVVDGIAAPSLLLVILAAAVIFGSAGSQVRPLPFGPGFDHPNETPAEAAARGDLLKADRMRGEDESI